MKYFLLLGFLLFFISDLIFAENNNDSIYNPKFNIHCGVGLNRGGRIGIQVYDTKSISFDFGWGAIPYVGEIISVNSNYHYRKYSGFINSLGVSHIYNSSNDISIITADIGYVFFNPQKSIYSFSIKGGYGLGFNDKEKFGLLDFDICLGVHFY